MSTISDVGTAAGAVGGADGVESADRRGDDVWANGDAAHSVLIGWINVLLEIGGDIGDDGASGKL
jgi:hypothetical protein